MAISFKAIRTNPSLIDGRATEAALRKNMQKYCDFVVKKLRDDYTDIPQGSYYKRKYKPPTGKLGVGGHWRIKVSGNGQTGDIYNDVPYARFVQGHLGQQSQININAGWHSIDTVTAATRIYFNLKMGDAIKEGIAKARQNRNRIGQFTTGSPNNSDY